MCTLRIDAPLAVSPHSFWLSFCSESSTPSTPSSSYASPATSAPRTTGPVRVAGLDALLTATGVDDEEDADFSHPLGSAAAARALLLCHSSADEIRRPAFASGLTINVHSDGDSDDDLPSGSDGDDDAFSWERQSLRSHRALQL